MLILFCKGVPLLVRDSSDTSCQVHQYGSQCCGICNLYIEGTVAIWGHHIPIVIVLCWWFLYLENLDMRAKTLSQSTLLFHGQYCWTQRGFTDTITKLEQTDNVRRKALLFIYTTYKQRALLTVISDQEGDLGQQHVLMDALFTQNISFPSF